MSHAAPDDCDFLDRLRMGDAETWRSFADAFRQHLRDLATAQLPVEIFPRADASDIVQQTLAEANEAIAAFNGTSQLELIAWMAVILRHNVDDAVRRHLIARQRTIRSECRLDDFISVGAGAGAACAADQTSPSMAAARNETLERLRRALDRLPDRQQLAVRMRHLQGRALADIAAELGCSVQAAAAVIARGLRELRAALQDLDH